MLYDNSFYTVAEENQTTPKWFLPPFWMVGELGRRRARDLQGYIVLWLMARAMMVNGFTTVRTTSHFLCVLTRYKYMKKAHTHTEKKFWPKRESLKTKCSVFFSSYFLCNLFSLFWNLYCRKLLKEN